ncbi:MAG: hypothetical protein GY950_02945 [bacterium]|nr:hypothetical protein [bacterium]
MGDDKGKKWDTQTCLGKLQDLLDALPSKVGDGVNEEELVQHKKTGQRALNHLNKLFGSAPQAKSMAKCKEGDLYI